MKHPPSPEKMIGATLLVQLHDGLWHLVLVFDDGDQYVVPSGFSDPAVAAQLADDWATHLGMTVERVQ